MGPSRASAARAFPLLLPLGVTAYGGGGRFLLLYNLNMTVLTIALTLFIGLAQAAAAMQAFIRR